MPVISGQITSGKVRNYVRQGKLKKTPPVKAEFIFMTHAALQLKRNNKKKSWLYLESTNWKGKIPDSK